jgi:hypothetical protein
MPFLKLEKTNLNINIIISHQKKKKPRYSTKISVLEWRQKGGFVSKTTIAVLIALSLLLLQTSPYGQETEPNPTERFLARKTESLREYKAFRHIEFKLLSSGKISSLDVETELSNSKIFTYKIVKEDSLKAKERWAINKFLDDERKEILEGNFAKSDWSSENYIFDRAKPEGEFWKIVVSPKNKSAHLVKGFLLVKPDGELLLSEGNFVKNPSFWVRDVLLSIKYVHLFGTRVPISLTSTGKIRWYEKYSLSMDYKYISVNGLPVL